MKTEKHRSIRSWRTSVAVASVALAGCIQSSFSAESASSSELLEKGIYSEETKGDLEAAMRLYQQVVADGKQGQAVAAQAQYRLGVLYYKKKDFAQATAAFEKVVSDYPEQKEVVALARDYLAGAVSLLPAPWADGEQLRLDINFQSGFRIGMATYTVASGEANGHKIWRLSSQLFAGVQQFSRVEVEADSFKPLHSRWKHTLIGDAEATYSSGHTELKTKGKDGVKTIELKGIVYDNEEVVQLMRRLPLTANYTNTIQIITTLGGGTIVPLKLEVTGIEKLEVPAGSFECYKVELSLHQTFWLSTDAHHYLVKFEAGGVIAELAAIIQTTPGQAAVYQDKALNISVSAPPDWLFDAHKPDDAKSSHKIFILDPDAIATTMLTVASQENLKPEEKKSLRAWADSEVAEGAKTLKDVKVRPDSWKERTMAGQPAISVIADFTEGREKKAVYAVYSFVRGNAIELLTYAPTTDLEAFRPKFEAIVDSVKTNP